MSHAIAGAESPLVHTFWNWNWGQKKKNQRRQNTLEKQHDQEPLAGKIQEVKTFIKFPTKLQPSLVLLEH